MPALSAESETMAGASHRNNGPTESYTRAYTVWRLQFGLDWSLEAMQYVHETICARLDDHPRPDESLFDDA